MENKKKWVTQFAVFAITFAIAFFVARLIFSKDTNSQLEEIAIQLNAKTPMMIDAQTRLDHVKVSGDTLQYEYTLVNVSKQDTATDVEGARKFLMSQAQSNLDDSPEMQEYRKNDVSLQYRYRDKSGQELLEFKISPSKK